MVTSSPSRDPRDPKPNNYEKVKTAQGQPVEPEGDIPVNDSGREGKLLHFTCFHSRRAD